MIKEGKQVRTWKEMSTDHLNTLSPHLLDETEENHKEYNTVHPIDLPVFESYTS